VIGFVGVIKNIMKNEDENMKRRIKE